MLNKMIEKAHAAMKNAYAPYSKFHVGACIRSENDDLFVGCNVENVSYSLTICAESAAISAMIVDGKKSIKEIVITSSGDIPCPPCGACRQRLFELASSSDTLVHLCVDGNIEKTITVHDLLPYAFRSKNLRGKIK